MKQELISIVVPIYNTDSYLEKCIKSIINQTYKNLEIILINDGSTDNSLNIINKYKKQDHRIRVINQSNKGLSECRNIGIKKSKGEFIAFIDSDDYVDLKYIEILYKNIKEYDECYSRLSFNEHGDNIYNESHEEHYEFAADYKSIAPEVDDGTVDRLNKLNDYVINNGGTMVVAGFPIAVDNEATREQYSDFELFQERLSSKLECEVISDFTDYFIDYDYYFNNKFHLSADGARLRTQKLIEDMNKKLR